jgi:hypothetical protein
MDNQSSYLDFVGKFKDGKMILSRAGHKQGRQSNPATNGMVQHHTRSARLELGGIGGWR